MKYTLITFLALIFTACQTKPLEVSIPQQEQKTVVFSQVIPGQTMIVALTKSFGALELQPNQGDSVGTDFLDTLLEDDATVTISYGGRTDTLFQIEKGLYASINTPQNSGIIYDLKIITDQGKEVTASAYMLPKVDFTSVSPSVNIGKDTTTTIKYTFDDFPNQENWYMINFYKQARELSGLDVNSIFINGSNNLVRTEIVSDATFNQEYSGSSTFDASEMSPSDTIAVTISNINEQYFKFLDLRKRGGNIFSEVTREPISYPSNVNNGYGFFNTHYPDIKIYDLNEH
jgi:hypothetical protein